MRYSPSTGLGFDLGTLIVLMVVLIGVAVWLRNFRQSGWTPALWLPVAIVAGFSALSLAGMFMEPLGHGEEAGWAGLGHLFALMFGWPWLVIFATALWAFPHKWKVLPTIVGLTLTVAAFAIPYYNATQPLVILAIDPDGKPVPKLSLMGSTTRDGEKVSLGQFTTDERGCFSFRLDPNSPIRFEIGRTEKFYTAEIEVRVPLDGYNRPIPDILHISCSWGLPGSSQLSQGSVYSARPMGGNPIPFFLKPRDTLIDPPLQQKIRQLLSEARASGASANLITNACRNPESLDLIGDVADIIPAQPRLHDQAIEGMRYTAEVLHEVDALHDSLLPKNHIYGWHPSDQQTYEALCRWAGVAPSKPAETKSAIEQKIHGYADQLIDRSRPYWTEEHHSVQVVAELRRLGKPAIAMFPQALSQAHPRAREAILHALWDFAPTVTDLDWFVSNDDPDLVIAGYNAVESRIKPDEVPLALERLQRYDQPGADTRRQMFLNHLLSAFRDRLVR